MHTPSVVLPSTAAAAAPCQDYAAFLFNCHWSKALTPEGAIHTVFRQQSKQHQQQLHAACCCQLAE
jgi:hypothetical protein